MFSNIHFQTSALKALYGKMSMSHKKITSFRFWKNGETIAQIALKQRVAEAMAEVYIIDMLAQGSGSEDDYKKILEDLAIDSVAFEEITNQISKSGITLREIKDATDFRYNQIRAVIAVSIHDFAM